MDYSKLSHLTRARTVLETKIQAKAIWKLFITFHLKYDFHWRQILIRIIWLKVSDLGFTWPPQFLPATIFTLEYWSLFCCRTITFCQCLKRLFPFNTNQRSSQFCYICLKGHVNIYRSLIYLKVDSRVMHFSEDLWLLLYAFIRIWHHTICHI